MPLENYEEVDEHDVGADYEVTKYAQILFKPYGTSLDSNSSHGASGISISGWTAAPPAK